MNEPIPERARKLAAHLHALFAQDAELVLRLNAGHHRLRAANDRLWSGMHPNGLAAVYAENPTAVGVAAAEHRSEVLDAPNPLAAMQEAHWRIGNAFDEYEAAADERRQLAADTGEVIREFVDALVAAGWSEEQARNANVHRLANNDPSRPRSN